MGDKKKRSTGFLVAFPRLGFAIPRTEAGQGSTWGPGLPRAPNVFPGTDPGPGPGAIFQKQLSARGSRIGRPTGAGRPRAERVFEYAPCQVLGGVTQFA